MTKDFEKLWTEGPDPLADVAAAPATPAKARKTKEQNYLQRTWKRLLLVPMPQPLSGYGFFSYGVCARKSTLYCPMIGWRSTG